MKKKRGYVFKDIARWYYLRYISSVPKVEFVDAEAQALQMVGNTAGNRYHLTNICSSTEYCVNFLGSKL